MLADHLFCRTSSQLTTEARLSLICQIVQLPCLLVQYYTTKSTNDAFLTVLTYLLALDQKMKSRPTFIEECILHYRLFFFTENLEPIVNILQHGVNDSDRNVRVSAG